MIEKRNSNYRWYILTITMLVYAVIAGAARLCMPVLFKEISDDLGLSLVQVGTIWGMDPLAGVFIGLPSGLLADRFGVKRTITVVCILAGILGALRGFSVNFFTMAATMFLFGFTAAATPSIVPKVTAEWFSGEKLGLANALLNVAWSVGAVAATMTSATLLSPWLGGWRNVMFFYGAPALALGLLWWFTGREPDKSHLPEAEKSQIPFKQAISDVIRIKEVWIIGIVTLFTWGASMGFVGYLPLYLRNLGWSNAAADSVITAFSGITLVGSVPMALLSDKLHSRRGVLILSIAGFAVSLVFVPYVNALGIWLLVLIGGFLRSGAGTLVNVIIFENKDVGSSYGGTAVGLASTVSMFGAFIAPPLGNSLEKFSTGLPFIFWAGLGFLAIPLIGLIKPKAKSTGNLSGH
jgi:NNP family nitrate/nitrite transporter-like MFS transporter